MACCRFLYTPFLALSFTSFGVFFSSLFSVLCCSIVCLGVLFVGLVAFKISCMRATNERIDRSLILV